MHAEDALTKLRGVTDIACQPGNYAHDPYLHGMANGLILALAILTDRDPEYLNPPEHWGDKTGDVVSEIHAERKRQTADEGWSCEHDDGQTDGELAAAAAAYSLTASGVSQQTACSMAWPWSPQFFKPKDARRDLIRAAALIVAEIERLDRGAEKAGGRQ